MGTKIVKDDEVCKLLHIMHISRQDYLAFLVCDCGDMTAFGFVFLSKKRE